ncbi:hypothetical protein UF75_0720 [Desulfosporosinus sp. I2]|nr:hypothetical protein UF75_0720 [Desulfosporosinus sp. I2]
MIREPGDLPKMLKSFHIVGSDGDEGKVPATDLFVVGTFLFFAKQFKEEY